MFSLGATLDVKCMNDSVKVLFAIILFYTKVRLFLSAESFVRVSKSFSPCIFVRLPPDTIETWSAAEVDEQLARLQETGCFNIRQPKLYTARGAKCAIYYCRRGPKCTGADTKMYQYQSPLVWLLVTG